MLLEHVEIVGFRGINRLSLMLEHSNVLVGENAWGKSSLLDALTLLLSPQRDLYSFTADDFWFAPGQVEQREQHLHIIFTFRETSVGEYQARRYRALSPAWVKSNDGYARLVYRLTGTRNARGEVNTRRDFLDMQGETLTLKAANELARHVMRLNPVLRLRDARFMPQMRNGTLPDSLDVEMTARQLDLLTSELVARPQHFTDQQIRHGLSVVVRLLEHYFAEQNAGRVRPRQQRRRSGDEQSSWHYLDIINRIVEKPGERTHRTILLGLFSSLLQANGTVRLSRGARPLLLVEDPETRLHPIMLSVAWDLLNLLPLQKITTTNSSELLSMTPMEQVCRLVRDSEEVTAWRLGAGGMNAEDGRRIAFHIRTSRPASLFARCWLLVEGETEVWLMNELARQCGYHFNAEGIRIIEFAQAGLKPLIKFACRMGIEWHVLVDGDEAGKKYAATVEALLNHQQVAGHLTALPAPDIEHFMYRQGFANVFHHMARLPENIAVSPRRVIVKAIHRSSKPDLAIAIALEAGKRGPASVPSLLHKMFARICSLARSHAN